MEIEKKDIYLHSFLFIVGIMVIVVFSYFLFSWNFSDLEEEYAIQNTHMLIHDIEYDELKTLSCSASNLLVYAQHEIPGTGLCTLGDKSSDDEFLITQNVESLLVYNLSNESLIFGHTVSDASSSAGLQAYLESNPGVFSECMNKSSLSGLVFLPERTLLVSMESSTSDETGGDGFVLVVSRTIDFNEMDINQNQPVAIVLEDIYQPYELDRKTPYQIAGDVSLTTLENGDPAGEVLLYDIMGNPAVLLKVGTANHTFSTALKMALYLGIALLIVTAIELCFHIYLAKDMSFKEFNILLAELVNIKESGDLSSRVAVQGDDQVDWIANNINDMLDSLEKKEGKYHTLFEQSNDAIIIFGPGPYLIDSNSMTSELLGYEKGELLEMDVISLSPSGSAINLADIYEQTIREVSLRSEINLVLSNNNVIDADISSSIIDKEEATVQVIIRDITIKKIYEEALLNAKIEADAANRAKSQFLANMSHELRTPLNSIIGFSDMLLLNSSGKVNEKQEHYLHNISTSGKHLLNLINDILDLSKIEAGMVVLNMEDISVAKLLDDVMEVSYPLASSKDITLTSHLDKQLDTIRADGSKMKQILLNLLSNAVKFTPYKGSVSVTAEKYDTSILFAVKDTGIGISVEDQDYLFYEFTQVDSDHNRRYQGTGLGLALVKKFVEMHKGMIWVESEPGKGSEFYFTIPIDSN